MPEKFTWRLVKRRFSVKVVAARAGYQHAKGFTAEFNSFSGKQLVPYGVEVVDGLGRFLAAR